MYTCVPVCMYLYVCTYIYVCVYIYIYIYITDKEKSEGLQSPRSPRGPMHSKVHASKEIFEIAEPWVVAKWPQFQVLSVVVDGGCAAQSLYIYMFVCF